MSEIKINNIPVITENNGSVSVTTGSVITDTIYESTAGSGVAIDGLKIKDTGIQVGGLERVNIDSSGRVTMPYQPSFLAHSSPSKDGSNYVYNFGIVAHNVGNHYNNSNGIFTAPISGTYIFTASIWAESGQNSYLLFYVNGNEMVGGHIYANGAASSGYVTMIAQIIAGDPVQLLAGYSIQGSQPRNYFSGILIG